jgi:hypothetical protein
VSLHGQRRQEVGDLLLAHPQGVLLAMEENKALDPLNVRFFRPQAVMP